MGPIPAPFIWFRGPGTCYGNGMGLNSSFPEGQLQPRDHSYEAQSTSRAWELALTVLLPYGPILAQRRKFPGCVLPP